MGYYIHKCLGSNVNKFENKVWLGINGNLADLLIVSFEFIIILPNKLHCNAFSLLNSFSKF